MIRKGILGKRSEVNGCRVRVEHLGGLLLLFLLFWLRRRLLGGIWPIQDRLCTRDDVLGVHSRTLLREECRLALAASIPDNSPNNGEENDSANNASRNCGRIRTSAGGYTGGCKTDGHRTLVTGARGGEAEVSDESGRLQTTYLRRSSQV